MIVFLFCFFFVYDWFYNPFNRLFHLFRADRLSEWAKIGVPGEKSPDPAVAKLGVSHVTRAFQPQR